MPIMLKPDLHMRKDVDRVVVYRHDETEPGVYSDDFGWRLLHPSTAILIALFDGVKQTEQVIGEFGFLTDLPDNDAKKLVLDFIDSNQDLMTDDTSCRLLRRRYQPEDFLMDGENLDFSTHRLKLPIGVVWVVTLDCPFTCRYCYADVERQEACDHGILDPEQIRRVVDQFQEIELARVGISGGDPFSHPHILELLRLLAEANLFPEVPTKTPLSRNTLQQIKDCSYASIQFSLDSPTDGNIVSQHLNIPDNGYLAKMRRSMQSAHDVGLMVGINAVITQLNIDAIPDMIRLYGDLGYVYRLNFAQAGASIYRSFPELMAERETYEKYEAIIDEMKPQYPHMRCNMSWLADPTSMTVKERADYFRGRPRCSGGRWEFTLLPNGDMTLCEELYYYPEFIIGNILETPMQELWNSEKMLSILYPEQEEVRGGPCADCDFWHECNTGRGRCWLRALKAYQGEPAAHNWPDPFCPKAPAPKVRVL